MTKTQTTRRWLAKSLTASIFALISAQALSADTGFPQKPITLLVPFPPGGSLDATARIVGEKLKDVLGQPVLIVNRPGAGSAVGTRMVAAASADGYTLLITSGSAFAFMHLVVPNFELKLADFVPVAAVASNPSVIAVSSNIPAKTLPELVEYARSNPGVISFCSTGVNGMNHLQLEMFKRLVKAKTGADFVVTHVPYNGLAPALVGLKDKSVQACTVPYTSLLKQLLGNDLRILAIQREKRSSFIPNVPTTGEQGYAEMDANDAFVPVAAPKGTPPAVIAKLEGAFRQVMKDPVVLNKLEELDIQGVFLDSKETRRWLEDDVKKFSTVIREAGLGTTK